MPQLTSLNIRGEICSSSHRFDLFIAVIAGNDIKVEGGTALINGLKFTPRLTSLDIGSELITLTLIMIHLNL